MPEFIDAELFQEAGRLAAALQKRFAQPEFIPGCEVVSVADVSEYATNNGWVEAICGQHNRQRVRWKSSETVSVSSYIDVLYFPDRQIFEAYGLGGAGAVPGSGGWPFTDTLTVDPTDPDANYPSLAAGVADISAGQRLLIGSNLTGTSGVAITAVIGLVGTMQNVTISGSGHQAILTIIAAALIENLSLNNSYSSGTITCASAAANAVFRNVSFAINSGNTGGRQGVQVSTFAPEFYDCEIDITSLSGQTAEGIYSQTGGSADVYGGRINVSGDGTNYAVYADTGTVIRLHGVTIESGSIGGPGTVTGWYYDEAGNLIVVPGTGISAGIWLIDESAGLRTKYSTIADAVSAAASGDSVWLDSDTYDLSTAKLTIDKAITLRGSDPKTCIITNSKSNDTCIEVTVDNVRIENLTINHTGTGTGGATVRWATNNLIISNCYLNTTGAASGNYVLDHQGGSTTKSQIINCYGVASGATSNSGYVNTVAAAKCDIIGGSIDGATYDIYGDQAGSTLGLNDPILVNGYSSWAGDVTGQYHGTKLVTNSSGATAPGRDIGYIDENGDYVTTTTANYFKEASNCVVVISGGSTKKCFVATEGRWPIRYTGSAPSDGDFLVTSTTGGAAAAQATMLPEIFARCQAAGASNVVTALLMTGTKFVPATNANDIYRCASHSNSDFVATINGAPTATSVVYNAPSSGAANVLVPSGTILGQLVLWNSTRSTGRLITAVDTGTSTITTVSTTDAWASGDTITFRSVTIADSNTARYGEIDLSNQTAVPPLARAISLTVIKEDTGGITFVLFHPIEAFAASKQSAAVWNLSAGNQNHGVRNVPLINRRFGWRSGASGSGTATDTLRLAGYWMATP